MLKKNHCLPFFLFFLLPISDLWAQFTAIPDSIFEQHLIDEGIDFGVLDGQVPTINLQGITDLILPTYEGIADLTGIEDMKDLVILKCSGSKIEELDISHNLKLEELDCSNNALKTLDVTKNFRLKSIKCRNNELTELDLTQNFDLEYLGVQDNKLRELDLRNNAFLEKMYVKGNELQALDLSNNTNLRNLFCSRNELSELDVSHNKLLESFHFSNNLLTEIDVSQNKELILLYFSDNEISTLDISQNEKLRSFYCQNNQLTNIHFPMNSNLETIDCRQNQLTHLDVSILTRLEDFDASDNALVCLNVKNGQNHQFSDFDLLNNPSLTCIGVDDPAFSIINWGKVDPGVSFKLFCDNGCNIVGTKEIPVELAAKLFPNPSTETIQVEFVERIGAGTWTIYNPIGQNILNQNFADTDVLSLNPDLPSGIYFLQIKTNKGLAKSFKIYRH